MFFLHFDEQNQNTVPSFFTSIVPEPFATGLLQKLQGFTRTLNFYHFIFLASRSVSRNMRMSDILTEPFTFLVKILPCLYHPIFLL